MAVISELFSRQLSLAGKTSVALQWVWQDLRCHYQDEVFLYGGLTGLPVPPLACEFNPDGLHGNLLSVADEEGSVRLLDTRKPAAEALCRELTAHSNAIFDLAWIPGGTKLLTSSGDTSVHLWDVVGGALLTTFKAHTGSVKSVDVKNDDPSVFVSGSRDGYVMVWDTRCSTKGSKHKPVNSICMAHKKAEVTTSRKKRGPTQRAGRHSPPKSSSTDSQYSVTAVLFHGDNKIASAGTGDGIVKLWDLRRTYTNCRLEPPPAWHTFTPTGDHSRPYGFTSLVSDSYQSFILASCTDDIIYMYDTAGMKKNPVCGFSGHKNSSFYVKAAISPDGRYLLSGSSCGNAFIWEIDHPESPPMTLSGHIKEVTAVAWCPSYLDKVATCSDNNDIRLWRAVRQRNWAPGEFIGTCQHYTGEDHLKWHDAMKKYVKEDTTVCTVRNTHSQTGGGKQQQKSPTLLKFMNSLASKENFPVNKVGSCWTSLIDTVCTANSRSQLPALTTLASEKEKVPNQSFILLPVDHHSKPPQDGIPKSNLEHDKQEDKNRNLGKGSHSSTSQQLENKSCISVAQLPLVAPLIPAKPSPAVHCRSSVHSKQSINRTPPQATDLQGEVYHVGDHTGVSFPVDATPERSRTSIFRIAGQKRKLLPDVGETGKPAELPPKKKRKKQKWIESQKENSSTLKTSPEKSKSPSSGGKISKSQRDLNTYFTISTS